MEAISEKRNFKHCAKVRMFTILQGVVFFLR
jgi:hypothetical protein